MLLWLLGTALAAGPDPLSFPRQASVSCPSTGLCRIEVPRSFVADNGDSWLLRDTAGHDVPYAVLRDAPELDWVNSGLRPSSDRQAVLINRPAGRPVAAVRLFFPFGSFQAAARAETRRAGAADWTPGPWKIVSAGLAGSDATMLEVPDPAADEIRIAFDRPWPVLPRFGFAELALRPPEVLAPAHMALKLTGSGSGEPGTSVFDWSLSEPARILAIDVDTPEDVFRRPVSLLTWEMEGDTLVPTSQYSGEISRVAVGETRVDQTRLDDLDLPARRLALRVQDDLDAPLQIRGATATVARRVLLVRDAGKMILYGGSPEVTEGYDLQEAAAELARMPSTDAEVGQVHNNPGWSGIKEAAALLPGATLDRTRFLYARSVAGGDLTRVALPAEVLASAASDLSDLRLLDASDRQIPYILEHELLPLRVSDATETRETDGSVTRIRISLPAPGAPLQSLVLHSPDTGFERSVQVRTGTGDQGTTLGSFVWRAAEVGPAGYTLSLDGTVVDQLLIEIDAGDNRNIRVDPITLRAAQVAILAKIPPAGATLVYGDRARSVAQGSAPFRRLREPGWAEPLTPPRYDAANLADRLRSAEASAATVGPVIALGATAPTATDAAAVNVGLGVLVLGLLAIMARMLGRLRADTLE